MATTAPHARYVTWSRSRRLEAAVNRVLNEDWTQTEAADTYGVSRQSVNKHVQARRREQVELEERQAEMAERISERARGPLGLDESRRVGTFEEFDQRYFGSWVCPDCEVHHPTPQFHRDIVAALESDEKRLVINMPPYHAKSTLVTVKNSVYTLVKNPNHRRIIVSKSLPFARTFLHSIDQLLTNPDLYGEGPNLIEDWGPFKSESKNSVWSKEQIYVSGRVTAEKDPSIQVLGVGGQIYGRRADDIVCDDIADVENQTNPARVAQMLTWLDKEALSRIGRNGKMRWVGTRVHPGDVYSFLTKRPTYKVLQFPCILDDTLETTLWPDHFPYDAAVIRREEMKPAEWQLVYQNVDVPGMGASWTEEMLEQCKDLSRVVGQYDPAWRLILGLDLAGGSKDSGYTAGVVTGVDLRTGKRFLVDLFNEKSMKAPRLRDQILDFADEYPLYEVRVEVNGLQSQIVQYNEELVQALALRGVRVVPHTTHKNKWDSEFGVEAMAPLWSASMMSVPWGNAPSARKMQQLIEQLLIFPMGMVSDLVMASWFADLGCRDLLKRAHLPLFNERMRVPDRIRRRRVVVDFGSRDVRPVPVHDQRGPAGALDRVSNMRRRTIGRPSAHNADVPPMPEPRYFVNVPGSPDDISDPIYEPVPA